MTKKLVIVGDSAYAEVAAEYFETWSPYRVVAFAVEAAFLKRNSLADRPVISLDDLVQRYPPDEHDVFVAIVYSQLNRLRTRLAAAAKSKGYALASFVSPHAFVAPSARIGEHCFIFENNVVQSFVRLGDNVVMWSGNHVGHHSVIEANAFLSSHVVVSGFSHIGENCFLGVNVSVANNISIARDCWIGPGVVIAKDTKPGELYKSPASEVAKIGALRFFRVKE